MNKYQASREAMFDNLVANFIDNCCRYTENPAVRLTDAFNVFLGWADDGTNYWALRKHRTVRHFGAALRRIQTIERPYVDDSMPSNHRRNVYLELVGT